MGRRRVKILTMILIVAVAIIIALATLYYFTNQKYIRARVDAENVQLTLQENTLSGVYIAKTDIKRGDTLIDSAMADEMNSNDPSQARDAETAGAIIEATAEANVYQSEIYTALARDAYLTKEQLGSVALVDIPAGTPIMGNMITPFIVTHDTREFEITAVNLMVDQQENDIVDIRLMYPNAEDRVVLSKKQIKNLSLGQADFRTEMTENEILTYQSAVVDAYQITGAYLYTVRYVEPNEQDAATVNYLVRSETIDLMRSDPNILATAEQTMNAAARMSLEVRLGQLTEAQLAAVADGLNISDTAKNSVLAQNVDNNSAQIASYNLDSSRTGGSTDDTTTTDNNNTNSNSTGNTDAASDAASTDGMSDFELTSPIDLTD